MSKQKIPFFIRIIFIALTFILAIMLIAVNSDQSLYKLRSDIQLPWFVSSILFFPLILHGTHLYITVNNKLSYLYALLVDIICFLVPLFLTGFLYSDDDKTVDVTYEIIKVKLFITIAFAVIYLVVYMVKKKRKVYQ